ncbi:MAG: dipeptidase [Planctomycetaceae bacterium]|nr:dipeptidase [Planctomycetaceae bacterium]
MKLLIDGHLDLAWNAASHDRDLTQSLADLNQAESAMTDTAYRGKATITFPEMRSANLCLCLATLLARSGPEHKLKTQYLRTDLDYSTRIGSFAAAHAQRACYTLWEQQGHIRLIHTQADFDDHFSQWSSSNESDASAQTLPLGVILSMEGADPITDPDQLPMWHQNGLRAIGPVHYGFGQYGAGTATDGPLTADGKKLLQNMQHLNMGLDVTHLCDRSMEEALDLYEGTVWASHHNCRSLVPGDRQINDDQIKRVISKGGVIGAASDAWMLKAGWKIGSTVAGELKIDSVVDHIDHVCQLAGNTDHSAIGTDLDGGFGTEQTPSDLKSYTDQQRLAGILSSRGYSDEDVEKIFNRNWLRVLRAVLPQA